MNLTDKDAVLALLRKNGFDFKKSMGQNFLIDPTVCPRMAELCCDGSVGVLEIGPGAGVLTVQLAPRCRRVVAVELDRRLQPVLAETLKDFSNVQVVFGDALSLDLKKLMGEWFKDCDRVVVCANLPYNITSPVITGLLTAELPVSRITVMVQLEAALRLCARMGRREAGVITAMVEYYAHAELCFRVPAASFLPPPKVDSAVIDLTLRKTPPVSVDAPEKFFDFVRLCFAQRRKTLLNNLKSGLSLSADQASEALSRLEIPANVRAEALTLEQLAGLYGLLNAEYRESV